MVKSLLAKPSVTLLEHTNKVVEKGELLSDEFRLNKYLKDRIILACALHDTGKTTVSFQNYIRDKSNTSYPHALASLPIVLYAESKLDSKKNYLSTASVISHHTPLHQEVFKGRDGTPNYLEYELENFLENINPTLESIGIKINFEELKILLNEVPSRLLYSQKTRLLYSIKRLDSHKYSIIKTILNIADWFTSGDIDQNIFLKHGEKRILEYIKKNNFDLYDFQKNCQRRTDDIHLVAPTGSGKTEAFLLWAANSSRIIYLLPTQTTTNSMWDRLKNIFNKTEVGLVHGKSSLFLKDNYEGEYNEDSKWEFINNRILSSVFAKPIIVATLDQYLLAYLHGRHWENKRALSRTSSLIIDEIHSYDPYTLGILLESIKLDPPQRMAIGSATFPQSLVEILNDTTMKYSTFISAESKLWLKTRHKLIMKHDDIFSSKESIISKAKEGHNVLCIVNSIDKSQLLYDLISEEYHNVSLLHSRFTYKDRKEKEKFVKDTSNIQNCKNGHILISTQVVEVSLDISFDVMFTQIAPIDALVQRLGRINRKGNIDNAEINIFMNIDNESEIIYGKKTIQKSQSIIQDLPSTPSDQDLKKAANSLYDYIYSSNDFKRRIEEGKSIVKELDELLNTFTINLNEKEMRNKFVTRKTNYFKEEVIPVCFKDDCATIIKNGTNWRIAEYMVPIPAWWFKKIDYCMFNSWAILADIEYDSNRGASLKTKPKKSRFNDFFL